MLKLIDEPKRFILSIRDRSSLKKNKVLKWKDESKKREIKGMDNQETKVLLSKEVLSKVSDGCYQSILRRIIFDAETKINWDKANEIIYDEMPELTKKEADFQKQYIQAKDKMRDTFRLKLDGESFNDYDILKIALEPTNLSCNDKVYEAYLYSGKDNSVTYMGIKPQYAEDLVKYYTYTQENDPDNAEEDYSLKFEQALNDFRNNDKARNITYRVFKDFETIIEMVYKNDMDLLAFIDDMDITNKLVEYMTNNYSQKNLKDLPNLEAEIKSIASEKNSKSTKELCDAFYFVMEKADLEKSKIEQDEVER